MTYWGNRHQLIQWLPFIQSGNWQRQFFVLRAWQFKEMTITPQDYETPDNNHFKIYPHILIYCKILRIQYLSPWEEFCKTKLPRKIMSWQGSERGNGNIATIDFHAHPLILQLVYNLQLHTDWCCFAVCLVWVTNVYICDLYFNLSGRSRKIYWKR